MGSSLSLDENPENIYIDTSYIQSFLNPKNHEEQWRKKQVRKAIEHTKKNGKRFVIFPLVVAGELINNLNKEITDKNDKKEIVGDFFEMLKDEKIDLKPARSDALRLAAKIKDKDHLLGDTDLLIASQALCDIHSVHLLIKDKKIIESIEIFNELSNMDGRVHDLKISDSIN